MTIRPAVAQDRAEWVRMRYALWPDCCQKRHQLEIQQLTVSEDSGVVLVAVRENGSLCGFAELAIRHDHVDEASSVPVAYLEGWYVDPDARGAGIGRRLLEAAEQWAAARGLRELASDAELDNHNSIQAHRSCGFQETCRTVHFIKPIAVNRTHNLQGYAPMTPHSILRLAATTGWHRQRLNHYWCRRR